MSWPPRTIRRRRDDRLHDRPWSPEEVAVLARAITHAPSVHNTQPWSLDVRERTALLYERPDPALIRQDPDGRDRLISCGAALADLVLAVRSLGWTADVRLQGSDDQPDLVATVVGSRREKPTTKECRRYAAIARRSSYRRSFEPEPLSQASRDAVLSAATSSDVHARWITEDGDALMLARLLIRSAGVHHADPAYQRELSMWTVDQGELDEQSGGVPAEALGVDGLAAVGLVTARTRLPDEQVLASRIQGESVLVLSSGGDERRDRLAIGRALQTAWLEATSLGLAGSMMTQPLRLSEVRSALTQHLELPGTPQILMRFGRPGTLPAPRSSRRPLPSVFVDDE